MGVELVANILIHGGDSVLLWPLAALIAASLALGGRVRAAITWCAAVMGVLGMVGLSKLAHLGWGLHLDAPDFDALSGHAAGAALVYPVLADLLLVRAALGCWRAGMCLACGASVLLACVLVLRCEHTAAEAAAGWGLGALASSAYLARYPAPVSSPRTLYAGALILLLCFTARLIQHPAPDLFLVRASLALSGRQRPYAWSKNLKRTQCSAHLLRNSCAAPIDLVQRY